MARAASGDLFQERLDYLQDPARLPDARDHAAWALFTNYSRLGVALETPLGPGALGAYLSTGAGLTGSSASTSTNTTSSGEIDYEDFTRSRQLQTYVGYGMKTGRVRVGLGLTAGIDARTSSLGTSVSVGAVGWSCPGSNSTSSYSDPSTSSTGICGTRTSQYGALFSLGMGQPDRSFLSIALAGGYEDSSSKLDGDYSSPDLEASLNQSAQARTPFLEGRLNHERRLSERWGLEAIVAGSYERGHWHNESAYSTTSEGSTYTSSYEIDNLDPSTGIELRALISARAYLSPAVEVRAGLGIRQSCWRSEGWTTYEQTSTSDAGESSSGYSAYHDSHGRDGAILLPVAAVLRPVDWIAMRPGVRYVRTTSGNDGCYYYADEGAMPGSECSSEPDPDGYATDWAASRLDLTLGIDVLPTQNLTLSAMLLRRSSSGYSEAYEGGSMAFSTGATVALAYRW